MSEGEKVVRGAVNPLVVVRDFVRSTVGAKAVMALTGLGLWGFVIAHLVGNLQIFQGADAINAYGVFLREIGHGALLWVLRIGMLVMFPLHIFTGMRLAALQRRARPIGYAKKKNQATNLAAASMALSGIVVLAFLVFHLGHFTWGWVDAEAFAAVDAKGRPDVSHMVKTGFSNPLWVAVYVIGQVVLFSHLFHGTASWFQSLGLHHGAWSPALRVAGRGLAVLILAGNLLIPLSILFAGANP